MEYLQQTTIRYNGGDDLVVELGHNRVSHIYVECRHGHRGIYFNLTTLSIQNGLISCTAMKYFFDSVLLEQNKSLNCWKSLETQYLEEIHFTKIFGKINNAKGSIGFRCVLHFRMNLLTIKDKKIPQSFLTMYVYGCVLLLVLSTTIYYNYNSTQRIIATACTFLP